MKLLERTNEEWHRHHTRTVDALQARFRVDLCAAVAYGACIGVGVCLMVLGHLRGSTTAALVLGVVVQAQSYAHKQISDRVWRERVREERGC